MAGDAPIVRWHVESPTERGCYGQEIFVGLTINGDLRLSPPPTSWSTRANFITSAYKHYTVLFELKF